jgi:HEPN domain-containing protein
MRNAIERARGLVRKAGSDFAIARLGLHHREALDMVCFHLQQGIEKLLKALLECRALEYPPTHNLVILLDLAETEFPELTRFRDWLPGYIPYAVRIRYDEALSPDAEETQLAFDRAEEFRTVAFRLLPAEVLQPEK